MSYSSQHRIAFALSALVLGTAIAQSAAQSGIGYAGNTIATPRPLDPATNSTNPSAAATQNQNPYLGSIATVPLEPGVRALTLQQAIELALRSNLGLIDSEQRHAISTAERTRQLSALLPHLAASASQHYTLAETTPTGGRKIGLSYLVVPYSYQSVDLELSQAAVDPASIYRLHAASKEWAASEMSNLDSRNIVVLAAGSAYIAISASVSRVRASEAELASAQVLETLMKDRVEHSVSPEIDLIRAKVAARTAEQRLTLAQNQLQKDKLAFTRIVGLPIEQQFRLATELSYRDVPEADLPTWITKAQAHRSDLKAARLTELSSQETVKATKARYLPSLKINAAYGGAGITPAHLYNSFDVSGSLSMPIFTSGEISSEVQIAKSNLAQRHAEYLDLQSRVQYDVRTAFLDLQAAQHSVSVAKENLELAQEGLKEAKDRFEVGLSNALEVVQAQQTAAEAEDNYISSVYAHNLAKLMLIRATGTAEADLMNYMGGN